MLSRHRRSPKNLTLNNVYSGWANGRGVISSISNAPWFTSVDLTGLDIAYNGVRSGMRFAAPILYQYLNEDGEITEGGYSTIGSMLWARYRLKWTHLWSLYNSEYNPLDSYKIVETRTRGLTRADDVDDSRTLNLSDVTTFPRKDKTTSQTRTPNISEETVLDDAVTSSTTGSDDLTYGKVTTSQGSNSSVAQDNVFGFNTASQDGVPQGKTTQSGTNSSTETNSGTDGRETTESTESARDSISTTRTTGTESISETESESYTGTESVNHTGTDIASRESSGTEEETIESTKEGNIFKAPAELLSIDRDFWLTEFFSIVFDDIDNMLTLSIYSESEVYHKVF